MDWKGMALRLAMAVGLEVLRFVTNQTQAAAEAQKAVDKHNADDHQ